MILSPARTTVQRTAALAGNGQWERTRMESAATPREVNQSNTDDELPESRAAHTVLAWLDRNRWWLFVAMVVLYAAAFTGRWRINPDSAIYMSLGRSLAETGTYTHNGEHHTRYEPGLPLIIAASYRIFGEDRYAPILVFELGCSLAAVALTYRLMCRHAGRPTAVLVAVAFGFSQTCLRYGFQVVTDTPFLVGVLAYLLAYEHLVSPGERRLGHPAWRWLAWVTLPLATLFMVAFRPTALTFVVAVGLACAWNLYRGPNRARHVVIALLTVAAFLSFRYVDPRRSTAGTEVKREQRLKSLLTEQRSYFVHRIPKQVLNFMEEVVPKAVLATDVHDVVPGAGTIVSLAVMSAIIPLLRRRILWAAWCAGTFAQLIWLPRERYLLPILPLLLYGMWLEIAWLSRRPRLSPVARRAAVAVPLAVYTLPNLALDVHLLGEQRRVGVSRAGAVDPNDAATLEMARQIAGAIDERDGETLVFATDHDELSYFSRRRVDGTPWSGRWPPTKTELEQALQRAHAAPRVYVVLPDAKDGDVRQLIEQLGMRPGPAVATVPRPADRKGRSVEPLQLHPLELASPISAPTTEPATAGDLPVPPR
jgi:hypothetical protein